MLCVVQLPNEELSVSDDYALTGMRISAMGGTFECRHDWKTRAQASAWVTLLNDQAGKTLYLSTDAGPGCSPRYDIVRAPEVGDKVSQAFNGDAYPDGEIVKVSPTFGLVTTSTGGKYYRHRETGSWIKHRTWSMIPGHVDKRNPSF